MQFINALVTSPYELDFRIHLRNEFLRSGLKTMLPVSGMCTFIMLMNFNVFLSLDKSTFSKVNKCALPFPFVKHWTFCKLFDIAVVLVST